MYILDFKIAEHYYSCLVGSLQEAALVLIEAYLRYEIKIENIGFREVK